MSPEDCYLPLRPLKAYSGIGIRKLRDHIADPVDPLPAYRVGGKLIVRKSEFDQWMMRRRVRPRVDTIVDEVLRDLKCDAPGARTRGVVAQ